MTKNKTPQRFGIFYRNHGKWTTGPYAGVTFTEYQSKRNPWKADIREIKNHILKNKIKILPVKTGV
jgi:hypothetical protein